MPERSGSTVSTYNNGQPYRPARGQLAPRKNVVDRYSTVHPIVSGFPTIVQFHRAFVRELKIRCYQPKTIKSYRNILSRFLKWFGNMPHKVSREDVRCYLEDLVDGGAKSDYISQSLAVIRTAFDKFNGRQVTLGLATPRRPKRVPVVLSESEVRQILQAARSLRDKLLIGLMYATGMRISEVTKLRWNDFDFQRLTVSIWNAKGKSDRQVTLPQSYAPLLKELASRFDPTDYVFPGEQKSGRFLSTRTGQRIVTRTVQLAGISKRITPHSFRHAFATHLLEHGTDIRFIQRLLGHVRLETTTIYAKVAVLKQTAVTSPLDRIVAAPDTGHTNSARPSPVGQMSIHVRHETREVATATLSIQSLANGGSRAVILDGIRLTESRPGWVTIELPHSDRWASRLEALDPACRARLESPEFFGLLRQELSCRFLASRSAP